MMPTARALLGRALRLNGVKGAGESLTTDEEADGLLVLNAMLDSWTTERLQVISHSVSTLSTVASTSSYTIGPTGDLVVTRPVEIVEAYMRKSDVDFPIMLVDYRRWNMISDKTIGSDIVELGYYNPTEPNGTLQVWPVPTEANVMYLTLRSILSSFATIDTDNTLAPGYERAIVYNLAVEWAGEFGDNAPASVVEIARKALAAIKRVNRPDMRVYPEIGRMFAPGRVNIETGE